MLYTGALLIVWSLWVTVWAPWLITHRTSTPFASETHAHTKTPPLNTTTIYFFYLNLITLYFFFLTSAGPGMPSRCVWVMCCQVAVAMQRKFGNLWGQSPGKQHLPGTSTTCVPVVLKLWLQPHLWFPTLTKPIRKPSKDSPILSATQSVKSCSWHAFLFSCCFGCNLSIYISELMPMTVLQAHICIDFMQNLICKIFGEIFMTNYVFAFLKTVTKI